LTDKKKTRKKNWRKEEK